MNPAVLRRLTVPALLLLTAVVFAQVSGHDFVNLDDHTYVLENPNLLDGLSARSVVRAFAEPYEHNWIPLTWISLQVDFDLYGREAGGYLLTNLALHALGVWLLFAALYRMTGDHAPAAFVAAIFAIHPLHVESVAWVSERKDVLCGLFWMATLWLYARYAEAPSLARWTGVFAACALALLAKPMAVTLPFVLLLLDAWPLARLQDERGAIDPVRLKRALLEKLPLLLLVLGSSAVTYMVQEATGAVASLERVPFGERVANALVSYGVYAVKSVWPTQLAVLVPYPPEPAWALACSSAVALVAMTVVAIRLWTGRPALLVGWLWYLGTLVPMIGIVQVGLQAYADRYTYVSQIGLVIMLAWSAPDLARRLRVPATVLAVLAIGSVAALAAVAATQVRHWRDTEHLYERALEVRPENFLAHKGLGDAYLEKGELALARRHFSEAARLHPGWSPAELGLADVWVAEGDVARALPVYERWSDAAPDDPRPGGSLGLALLRLGRFEEARRRLERAIAIDPTAAELHAGIAIAADATGDAQTALRANREALRRNPRLHDAANNLAWLLATSDDPSIRDPGEAVRIAENAARQTDPPSFALLDTLAVAYAAVGRFDDAASTAARAARQARREGAGAIAREIDDREALFRKGRSYTPPH